MKPRKEIEEQLCRNACMNLTLPDSVMIGDAIRTLARIMLDVRDLLIQIEIKDEEKERAKRNKALRGL